MGETASSLSVPVWFKSETAVFHLSHSANDLIGHTNAQKIKLGFIAMRLV